MVKNGIEEYDQSEFNAGIATLMRIDAIKRGLNTATIMNDPQSKFRFLKAYFLEMIGILTDEDDEKQKERYKEIFMNYREFEKAQLLGKKQVPLSLIHSFDEWEFELRNLEQSYGLNLPKKQDSRFAMAGKGRRR